MQDFGPESFSPDEGGGGGSEALSEEARQRFAAQGAAGAQVRKDEQKSRKRDTDVAQAILKFLTDKQKTHLATLIVHIVARDCPSSFLLAVLSLINEECKETVDAYFHEHTDVPHSHPDMSIVPADMNESLRAHIEHWIQRMARSLTLNADTIVAALRVEEKELDGNLLQLTAFVLKDFFAEHKQEALYENVQPMAAGILHSVFAPHLQNTPSLNAGEDSSA